MPIILAADRRKTLLLAKPMQCFTLSAYCSTIHAVKKL